jgi:hypothetical protein
VEIPLTFGVEKQKHLRVRSDKSDPSTRVNFLATESAKLSLENHGSAALLLFSLETLKNLFSRITNLFKADEFA